MLLPYRVAMKVEEFTADMKDLDIAFETVTCEKCFENDSCFWSWDLYNTDGACLAKK